MKADFEGEPLSIIYDTGPIFGLNLTIGQQFFTLAKFLEISMDASVETDFDARMGEFSNSLHTYNPDNPDEDIYTIINRGFLGASWYALAKIHVSEIIGSSADFIRPFAGFGFSIDMLRYQENTMRFRNDEWVSEPSRNVFETLTIPELIAGVEILPVRDFCLFADYRLRLNQEMQNILLTPVMNTEYGRPKVRFGVMYYAAR